MGKERKEGKRMEGGLKRKTGNEGNVGKGNVYVYASRQEKEEWSLLAIQFLRHFHSGRHSLPLETWLLALAPPTVSRGTPTPKFAKLAHNLAGFPTKVRPNIFLLPLNNVPGSACSRRNKNSGPPTLSHPFPPPLSFPLYRQVNYLPGSVNKKKIQIPGSDYF